MRFLRFLMQVCVIGAWKTEFCRILLISIQLIHKTIIYRVTKKFCTIRTQCWSLVNNIVWIIFDISIGAGFLGHLVQLVVVPKLNNNEEN